VEGHTAVFPAIEAGAAGIVLTVTDKVDGELEPEPLLAVTLIFPLLEPAVTEMELVVEVPVHPPGNVHV
jgi:hypothetical protein